MDNLNIVYVSINELKPAEYNPRKARDKEWDDVRRSIERFGLVDPIIVNTAKERENIIIGGHLRVKVAKSLGIGQVPVVYIDIPDIEKEKELNLRLNKNTGSFDWDMLANYDEEFLLDVGFTIDELEDVFQVDMDGIQEEDDNIPAVAETTNIKAGDMFALGEHRLICGDSTQEETYIKLLGDKKANMIFADPPYGMKKSDIENDNLNPTKLLEFNRKWIPLSVDFLIDVGSWYCWGKDEGLMDIYSEILKPMIAQQKITFRNLITWDKGNGQGQTSEEFRMYPIADEKCLFVMCGVQGFNNNADNYYEGWESLRLYLKENINKIGGCVKCGNLLGVSSRMIGHYISESQWIFPTEEAYNKMREFALQNGMDAFKKEYEEIKKEYYATRAYFDNMHDNMNNVWHFDRHTDNGIEKEHSTPKPLPLCQRAIRSSSREGEIVLDPFLGSGSTLIACEQINRICYGIELDPHYCDVIIKRWENYTGKKAEKIN